MDPSGKLIYTRNHDVLSGNLQTISDPSSSPSTSFTDGSRLPLSTKEIGSTEIFATSLLHSPNG
jgi:coatomer subunit beta'